MNLTDFLCKYELHDCNAFLPFEVERDAITVVFDLAKHMQYSDFKAEHPHVIEDKAYSLIVKARFLQCTNIRASEWIYGHTAVATKTPIRQHEKNTTVSQFDKEMFLYSISTPTPNEIAFLFECEPKRGGEIRFACQAVEVLEEGFLNKAEYDKLWGQFES